jgi:hypothetical protein
MYSKFATFFVEFSLEICKDCLVGWQGEIDLIFNGTKRENERNMERNRKER